MINDIKKDMIEQLSYFKETNPKGYMPYDDVQEMVDGVLEKHNGIYPDYKDLLYKYDSITTELQVYKDKEDKLREYCNAKTIKTNLPLYTKEVIAESKIANDVLQILNEGE